MRVVLDSNTIIVRYYAEYNAMFTFDETVSFRKQTKRKTTKTAQRLSTRRKEFAEAQPNRLRSIAEIPVRGRLAHGNTLSGGGDGRDTFGHVIKTLAENRKRVWARKRLGAVGAGQIGHTKARTRLLSEYIRYCLCRYYWGTDFDAKHIFK